MKSKKMTNLYKQASPRKLGAYERRMGYEFRQNPYPMGTVHSREWSKGWRLG